MFLYGGEQGFQEKQGRQSAVRAFTGQQGFRPAFRGRQGFPPAFAGQQVPPALQVPPAFAEQHGFVQRAQAQNSEGTDGPSQR
jgi:hypothetical protein